MRRLSYSIETSKLPVKFISGHGWMVVGKAVLGS